MEKKLYSIRELREAAGVPLQADDFVPYPEPCSNPRLHVPLPEVPRYLMDPDKADLAESALSKCWEITAPWGAKISRVETSEFQEANERFKEATDGVDAWDIIELSRERFLSGGGPLTY